MLKKKEREGEGEREGKKCPYTGKGSFDLKAPRITLLGS